MRASALFVISALLGLATPALAAETPKDIKGLYLLTDYPAVSVRPGQASTISLRLQNYGLAPERYQLSVAGVPDWMDRDAAGRRPAGRRGDAGDGFQCRPAVASRHSGQCPNRHPDADGQGRRAGQSGQPAGRGDAGEGIAGQARGRGDAAVAARHAEVELRLFAQDQERLRPQPHRQLRRQRAAQLRDLVHRGLRHASSCPRSRSRPGSRRR